jgi:predicted transcriptional regulator
MSSSELLKNYDSAGGSIRTLCDSRLRLAILDSLRRGPMRLADLRRAVDASAPNASVNAKGLEEMGLIERVEGDFTLTPYGRAACQRTQEFFKFWSTYEKFKGFWTTHKLDGIPEFLLLRLDELENSTLMNVRGGNVDAVNELFEELFNSVKEKFYAVAPILRKQWWDIGADVVRSGIDTHIIVTPEVLKLIITTVPKEELLPLDAVRNLKWSLIESCSVACAVSEKSFSMVLENKGGGYSLDMDLDSRDPHAVKWGMDLFEYYKKRAKPFKLAEYL